jgi:hypothetical protein
LCLGTVIGSAIAVPIGILLSYGAALPFFLGLFFFALFGLVIGAVTHRAAAPSRPFSRGAVLAATLPIVLVGWWCSILREARDFPGDMVDQVGKQTKWLGDQPIGEFRAETVRQVQNYLIKRYPPGGVIGYVQWIALNGELQRGELEGLERRIARSPRKFWWVLRGVLSLALLGFGVASQTWSLTRVETSRRAQTQIPPADESKDL